MPPEELSHQVVVCTCGTAGLLGLMGFDQVSLLHDVGSLTVAKFIVPRSTLEKYFFIRQADVECVLVPHYIT